MLCRPHLGQLDGLGQAHVALSAYGEARDALGQALRIATEMAFIPLQLAALVSVAELQLAAGNQDQGLPLVRMVARHPAANREATQRAHSLLLSSAAPAVLLEPDADTDEGEDLAAAVAGALEALEVLNLTNAPVGASGIPDVAPVALVEKLTERERAILNHIAAGRSNQEIADLLIFSVGTVKWDTTQTYGMLGVRSRTQAIARARELGLLQ